MCVSLMLYKEALCSFVQLFNSYPFPVEKSSWLLPINVFAVGSVYAGSLNNLGQLLLSKYDVFVVVVCLALLLKGAAAKVIEELEWVKRNINVFRIKEKNIIRRKQLAKQKWNSVILTMEGSSTWIKTNYFYYLTD